MSLYDGLDLGGDGGGGETKADVSGWGSRMKLLESQKQLQAKKALLVQKKKPAPSTTLAPVIDLKRRNDELPLHFNQQTGRLERMSSAQIASQFIAVEMVPLTLGPDEYDPFRPNEYEDFVKKRKQQRQKEREEERVKAQEERERRRKERHAEEEKEEKEEIGEMETARRRHEEEEEDEVQRLPADRSNRGGGAAIAPPMSLIESDKSVENSPAQRGANGREMAATPGYGKMGSVASKIMQRMGYRHGQGLGKTEQGMSTALQVEKTSKRGGKIIHEKDTVPSASSPQPADTSNANLLANPSKVILLLNMVSPGEVDADLEPETAEECQKYGKVAKCVICEVPEVPEEEAVRIFLEFEKVESAIKAVIDLNGRYFGGRVVKASFYDVDRFRRHDLSEAAD